jgi:hypothetical protein
MSPDRTSANYEITSETWKYNPVADTWQVMTEKIGFVLTESFKIGNSGIALGALDIDPSANENYQPRYLKYNQQTNSWLMIDDMPTSLWSKNTFSFTPCEYLGIVGNSVSRNVFSFDGDINIINILGPSPVCFANNSTFVLQNPPSGINITWTKSFNLTYVSGQGSNAYVVKAKSNRTSGAGWVEATISGSCGTITLPRKMY